MIEKKDLISHLEALLRKFLYYVGQDNFLVILHFQAPLQNDFQVEAG